MKPIKFSHHYTKFNNLNINDPVTLIMIQKIHYTELTPHFLQYDAEYTDCRGNKQYYPVPCSYLIMLCFKDNNGRLFTTLRRYTERKYTYYQELVGSIMRVEVTDGNN